MDTKKMSIKKFLAREGLILLGVVLLGLAIYFIARNLNTAYVTAHPAAKFKYVGNMKYILIGYTPYINAMSLGLNIAMLGYPIIAIARFIIWAMRIIREKTDRKNA